MTGSNFEKAKNIVCEIEAIEKAVSGLSMTLDKKEDKEEKRWLLSLFNRSRSSDKGASATIYYGFEHGIDIPVDRQFVEFLKDYFEKQLAEKRREFEAL